jgi:hypothetical protein
MGWTLLAHLFIRNELDCTSTIFIRNGLDCTSTFVHSKWAALPSPLADPTPGPAAARCRSAGRPPAPGAADMRTGLWAVADVVRALAALAAGAASRRGLKPVYVIYILETHEISVAWMKDTVC